MSTIRESNLPGVGQKFQIEATSGFEVGLALSLVAAAALLSSKLRLSARGFNRRALAVSEKPREVKAE
jgi:hypothetical protein